MEADHVQGVSKDSYHGESEIELIGDESERVPTSSKLNFSESRSSGIDLSHNEEDKDYVEITLDFPRPTVAFHSVKLKPVTANNDHSENDKLGLLGKKGMEKKKSYFGDSLSIGMNRIKQVSQELKRLASFSTQGGPLKGYDRTNSAASHALKGFKFISNTTTGSAWDMVEKNFEQLTKETDDGLLHRSLFAQCLGMNEQSTTFGEELFDVLSRRRNIPGNSINKAQLRNFFEDISDPDFDSRLRIFFDMVDKDANGTIDEKEIKEIIQLSATTNKLSIIHEDAKEYAALIMEELDPANTGYITVESLEMLLLHGTNNTTRGDNQKLLSRLLSLNKAINDDENRIRRWCRKTKYFLHDNWKRAWILLLWIGVMLGLFAYKFVQYRRRAVYEVMGHCVCMAKGAAETLKLNMAIILLPVCRNTVTWLRNKTKLGIAIPLDDNLNFHKLIAVGVAIGVGIHAIYHLACDIPRLLDANSEKYELMKPFFGDQPSSYWYFVKSWEGVTGIIMIILMAIDFTLASPWLRKVELPKPFNSLIVFNAFWYSHHLFFFVYALLIVHGIKLYLTKEWYKKTTWMYLAIPITIYALERLTRALRSSIKPVKILKVACPLKLLALYMSKPQGFRYKSRQYMFINCAEVSPFEWHPFSITSSPGDDYLSVHIKDSGDWTQSIRAKFLDTNPSGLPKVHIDGPYGAPSQEYKQYEVVLLVGLGIGATPMISILKDIVNNLKANEEEEGRTIEEGGTQSKSPRPSPKGQHKRTDLGDFKTKRAYFYWMTPQQSFFDWFKEVMDEVVEADHRGVIELHNHCTSVYEEGDARSTLIAMLQSLNHAKNGVDIVSGTRVKSHFAKPNWHSVYERIAAKHLQARVGVFYCGRPEAAIEIHQLASDFSKLGFTKFDFHMENF